jgi:pimeloyl-ACP methyl ester carboxylesterase
VTTFALVHGAWHGAWCWERLIPELERRGQRAITVDLPATDPNAGSAGYAEVVLEVLDDADDDVVLVGHSFAGLTIPYVAAIRPVRELVYLCALLPLPGKSFGQQAEEEPILAPDFGAKQIAHEDGSSSWPEDAAVDAFFHDCPPPMARSAAQRLRAQAWRVSNEVTPLREWPSVRSRYILATGDRAVRPEWSRSAARRRLGLTAVEIPGGHSPFFSRPSALADLLVG